MVNGRTTRCMAKAPTNGQMVGSSLAHMPMIRSMGKDPSFGKMGEGTKVSGKKDLNMAKVFSGAPRVKYMTCSMKREN